MQRITATYRTMERAERALDALEEAGFSSDLLNSMLHQHVDAEELEGSGRAEAMVVVDAEGGVLAEKAHTILRSAGAFEIQSVDQTWEPEPNWSLMHLGRPTNA